MKRKALYLTVICLALSLVLLACGPREPQASEITLYQGSDISTVASDNTGYAGLGLTEAEIKMLEERGVANVDSVDVASKIAGFKVTVPAYVPEGFQPGQFMINISGAGLHGEMSPKFNNTKVTQTFNRLDDRTLIIVLIQSPQQFSISGGEPADFCGLKGEKALYKADPAKGQPFDKLTFIWEKDGIWYALSGLLSGALDEAVLAKMACSISIE